MPSVVMTIALPDTLYKDVVELAEKEHKTRSMFVRTLLEQYVEYWKEEGHKS